jgi:putative ABC transport system substrate-binding protein
VAGATLSPTVTLGPCDGKGDEVGRKMPHDSPNRRGLVARRPNGCVTRLRVAAFALVVFALPFVAEAQQTGRIPRIGWLAAGPSPALDEAFRQALGELGYVEGKNIVIDYRSAETFDRLPSLAAELVRLKVDVIFAAAGAQTALAAKKATTTIPIVMALVADPVGFGLVDSLARPGGNITGPSAGSGPEVQGKRLELLKEAFPRVSRVGVLWNPDNPGSVINKRAVEAPAQSLRIKLQSVEVRKVEDLERAFSVMRGEHAEALMTINSPFLINHLKRIVNLAAKSRLAAVHMESRWVESGGLMSYGPSYPDLFRRAAIYVDKILKGANPSELPIEQPTKFELAVNLKTAKALGLTIPPSLLLRTDRIIE